jgi:hypothetical protein
MQSIVLQVVLYIIQLYTNINPEEPLGRYYQDRNDDLDFQPILAPDTGIDPATLEYIMHLANSIADADISDAEISDAVFNGVLPVPNSTPDSASNSVPDSTEISIHTKLPFDAIAMPIIDSIEFKNSEIPCCVCIYADHIVFDKQKKQAYILYRTFQAVQANPNYEHIQHVSDVYHDDELIQKLTEVEFHFNNTEDTFQFNFDEIKDAYYNSDDDTVLCYLKYLSTL